MLKRLLREEEGQDLVEYGLLLLLVGLALVLLMPELAANLAGAFTGWGDAVNDLWIPDDPD